MLKGQRLRRSRDITAVLREGRRWSNDLLVLGIRPNDLGVNRYGFSVGKMVGKAVRRNLVKRRMRNIVRELSTKQGWDIVVIARQNAPKAPFRVLQLALQDLLRSAGLLETNALAAG
ncbi:MAG: ribonuclease P protein component [Dehalococcoidia bacterium]